MEVIVNNIWITLPGFIVLILYILKNILEQSPSESFKWYNDSYVIGNIVSLVSLNFAIFALAILVSLVDPMKLFIFLFFLGIFSLALYD